MSKSSILTSISTSWHPFPHHQDWMDFPMNNFIPNRQAAKPYVVGHHAQWLGCCSTIQLSCIAVRDLESALRIWLESWCSTSCWFFWTNQRYHASSVFFPPREWWCDFLQNPNSLKRKIILFLGDGTNMCVHLWRDHLFIFPLLKKSSKGVELFVLCLCPSPKNYTKHKDCPLWKSWHSSRSCKPPPTNFDRLLIM